MTAARAIRTRRRAPASALALLAVLLAGAAAGCAPGYVLRAAYEEAKILWRREPLAAVLARGDLGATERAKLELIRDAREFGRTLGLDVGGSFDSLSYVDAEDTVFVVTAARRTALEPYTWWFPIVGSVPYKGFFDRGRAEREAAGLEARGYDTFVRAAAAFSTLGWFDDPVLRHWLRGDDVFLVDLVLHEVYHRTFFLKGPHASPFNESLANFVGHRGAIAFFAARPDAEAVRRRADARWEDERRFAAFVARLAGRLEALYAGAGDEAAVVRARDALFAAARAEAEASAAGSPRLAALVGAPLNNAVVLHHRLYVTDLDLFEAVWRTRGDLAAALDGIAQAAARDPDAPFAAVRAAFPTGAGTPAAAAAASDPPAAAAPPAVSPRP